MGDLSDIKHVVILTQENRSFDEYFGTFPGATGFSDPTAGGIFNQPGFSVSPNGLTPYRMSTFTASGIYGLAVNKGFGPGATGQPLVFASVNDGVVPIPGPRRHVGQLLPWLAVLPAGRRHSMR